MTLLTKKNTKLLQTYIGGVLLATATLCGTSQCWAFASSAPQERNAAKHTPVHPTVAEYVAGEHKSRDLFEFCQHTRPLVELPTVHPNPDCTENPELILVDEAATQITCKALTSDTVECRVRYKWLATVSSPNGITSVERPRATFDFETYKVTAASRWLITDPYKSAHIGKEPVLRHIQDERERIRGSQDVDTYRKDMARLEQMLRKTKGAQ